jgi:quinol monooxygenase YgiN
MAKVAVLAKMTAREGEGAALLEAMRDMVAAVDAEEGTEIYALHADTGNADVVWIYELYVDNDALGLHSGSEAMKGLGPKIGHLLGGRPEIMLLTPAAAKGLSL